MKPYPGMGRFCLVLDYGGAAVVDRGSTSLDGIIEHAHRLLRHQPTWAGRVGIVDQEIAAEPDWRKVRDCDHRNGTEARYEASNGWAVEHRKARGGPLGTQTRHQRVEAHYVIFDADGKQRADVSSTLKGAKKASNERRLIDHGWKRIGDVCALPIESV